MSLVPSATETLLAWGVEPVACTRFCEQPSLPTVGGTKDPDVAAIVALAPDVVVVDEEENRREDADALADAGVAVHVLAIRSLDDVQPAMAGLAAAVGVDADVAVPVPVPAARMPPTMTAFVPIWRRPWLALGGETYGTSVLAAVGVANAAVEARTGERYPEVDLDEVATWGVDVVVAPSEPYPFGPRQHDELAAIAPVVFVDGHDLFWWGVRTPAALTRLAEVLGGRRGGERSAST